MSTSESTAKPATAARWLRSCLRSSNTPPCPAMIAQTHTAESGGQPLTFGLLGAEAARNIDAEALPVKQE